MAARGCLRSVHPLPLGPSRPKSTRVPEFASRGSVPRPQLGPGRSRPDGSRPSLEISGCVVHLRHAVEMSEEFRRAARGDSDLDPLRNEPAFTQRLTD